MDFSQLDFAGLEQEEETTARRPNKKSQLKNALAVMGFTSWNSLYSEGSSVKKPRSTPGESSSRAIPGKVLDRLQHQMSMKMQEIEHRRNAALLQERKMSSIASAGNKNNLKKFQDAVKKAATATDDERALHEAYQILYGECERRRLKGSADPDTHPPHEADQAEEAQASPHEADHEQAVEEEEEEEPI